jgi:hypothetical protein
VQFFRKRGQQGVIGLDERSQLEIAHLEDVQYSHQLPDLLDAHGGVEVVLRVTLVLIRFGRAHAHVFDDQAEEFAVVLEDQAVLYELFDFGVILELVGGRVGEAALLVGVVECVLLVVQGGEGSAEEGEHDVEHGFELLLLHDHELLQGVEHLHFLLQELVDFLSGSDCLHFLVEVVAVFQFYCLYF